jgi:hypothetical protein
MKIHDCAESSFVPVPTNRSGKTFDCKEPLYGLSDYYYCKHCTVALRA